MKILETLGATEKEVSTKDKLKAITKLVSSCREQYGNTEAEITQVKVQTSEGRVSVGLLTSAEKVAVADREIRQAIANATAVTEITEGAVFDRAFESNIAVNPVLVNLSAKSDSRY